MPFSFPFLQSGTVIRSGDRAVYIVFKLGFVIAVLKGSFICISNADSLDDKIDILLLIDFVNR